MESLVGRRYDRTSKNGPKRYGYNDGTVRLGGKLVPIKVPRVRHDTGEITLKSYEALHANPELDAEQVLRKVISGVSIRDLEQILPESKGSIGASRSSISRRIVSATNGKLKEFESRSLSNFPIVAMFIDGTTFGDDLMIIALGVGLDGRKKVLGFIQSSGESSRAVTQMLNGCLNRGLQAPHGLLAIIDGAKGIRRALLDTFPKRVLIQRCQWHKRENVVGYMPKSEQATIRQMIQRSYDSPVYGEAKAKLKEISAQLASSNLSARSSLEEGLEETLTLHKLDMFGILRPSMKTTNCIEALNARVKDYCSNVKRWRNSSHKHRWLATAILELEKGFHRIQGHSQIPRLVQALEAALKIQPK